MVLNPRCILVFILFVVLLYPAFVIAVDTEDIEYVLDKAEGGDVLGDSDIELIDDFLASAFDEMLFAEDFFEAVRARVAISTRKGPKQANQYSLHFKTSAGKQIDSTLTEVNEWEDDDRKVQAWRNLVILLGELESMELVQLGLPLIDHEDAAIRYWAVKSITNPSIAAQLVSETDGDAELASEIVRLLGELVQTEKRPEILNLIARFAGVLEGAGATELLMAVADSRIKVYEDWTVKHELMDAGLLRMLGRKILLETSAQQRRLLCSKFAQLYSYVIQRFIMGDALSQATMAQLASVIVEAEQTAIAELMDRPQKTIRSAIEKRNFTTLQKEHDRLLGTEAKAGTVLEKLGFDYGKDTGGAAVIFPNKLTLPEEPAVASAENESETVAE